MGNIGYGHIFPREDGMKARCGGPVFCTECSYDLAIKLDDDERKNEELIKDQVHPSQWQPDL